MNDQITESTIQKADSLFFVHHRNSVDVHVYDLKEEKISVIKDANADVFLEYFSYNECTSDDKEKNIIFLKAL